MKNDKRPRTPRYGDRVYVPDLDGSWINGIVNSIDRSGQMLVGVAAHQSGAQAVTVNVREYLENWAWPEDMPTVRAGSN